MPDCSVDLFVEEWLPTRFAELTERQSTPSDTSLSLRLIVSDFDYLITVRAGNLLVTKNPASATTSTLMLRTDEASFQRIVVPTLEQNSANSALKMLHIDSETTELIGSVPGCLELSATSHDGSYQVIFGPGEQFNESPRCTVRCELTDLSAVQRGELQPMDLFMAGKLHVEGDLQIAMALGGILI